MLEYRSEMQVVIGLGSNIDPEYNIPAAVWLLAQDSALQIQALSRAYYTDPVGVDEEMPRFVNCVLLAVTSLSLPDVVSRLKGVELLLGRPAGHSRTGPRTIDLDLLANDGHAVDRGGVPEYLLIPLSEVAGDLVLEERESVAERLAGLVHGGASTLAREVTARVRTWHTWSQALGAGVHCRCQGLEPEKDSLAPADRLFIRDLVVSGLIGVNPDERVRPQSLLINVTASVDTTAASVSDRLEDTVNYRTIAKTVIGVVEGSSPMLVESVASAIAAACLEVDLRISEVEVTVEKPGSIRFAKSAGVTIRRTRSGPTSVHTTGQPTLAVCKAM